MHRTFLRQTQFLLGMALFCWLVGICRAEQAPLTILHSFGSLASSSLTDMRPVNEDGAQPEAALLQASDGLLYGTAARGGPNGQGVIFRLHTDGSGFQVLHSFSALSALFINAPNPDGAWPGGPLLQGPDESLYGVATQGGAGGSGTLFTLKTDGSGFRVLYAFGPKGPMYRNAGGARPARLTFGSDGSLYGAATLGGAEGGGVLFWIRPDGSAYKVLHTFSAVSRPDNTNEDGSHPQAALVLGKDGLFYGTTNIGGKTGYGVAYRMAADGSRFQVLHDFQRYGSGHENNGSRPDAGFVCFPQGFIGTTDDGGGNDAGVLYTLNSDGQEFRVLHTFSNIRVPSMDGGGPFAPPLLGADGRIYGTTIMGGRDGCGALYRAKTDGTNFQILHGFVGSEGSSAQAALIQGRDGSLYGAVSNSGPNEAGAIFCLALPTEKTAN